MEQQSETDFETIRKVLVLARDVYEAYKKAPDELKRLYLSLFFEGFYVKDQKIVSSEPTKLIKLLKHEGKIVLRSDWCPSPNLITIFEDSDYIAMVKEKLIEIKQFSLLTTANLVS